MELNNSELKPCPFCGCESVELRDMHIVRPSLVETRINVWVDCPDCPCGFHMNFTNEDKNWREIFVEKWNERPEKKQAVSVKRVRPISEQQHHQEKLF
ncbi:MAG: hypothetical protein CME82_11480 [Halomonas sp.]|nr:hypothetical protein [Halomonas sp.]|tara:strand:- start:7373 stop:7666 length:294 start_codon:yes stop_codon:yes gene_type:complete